MSRDHLRDESGVALVFALLAVIIVGGIAAVMIVRATSQTQATAAERSHEQAIHVAEAGLDDVIRHLNLDEFHLTEGPTSGGPHEYDLAASATESEERAWAVDIARNDCTLVATASGEACAIRPRLQSGGVPLPWVFGVSFVPSRADAEKTRVVKMQFDEGFFSPPKAVLTQGSLTLGGSLHLGGDNGAVHTNANITINGGAVTTTGPVTSSGSFTGGCSGCAPGSGSTGQDIDVVPVSATSVYRREAHAYYLDYVADSTVYAANEGLWYDLCPDGTVQVPWFDSARTPQPCTAPAGSGRVLYDATDPSAPARFNGWAWSSGATWSAGGGSGNNVASPLRNGAYYVFEGNAVISGAVDTAPEITLLVDAHGTNDPAASGTDTTCTGGWSGGESGSISVRGVGQGTFTSFLGDLLFLADRDVETSGNMNATELKGFIAAHEQISIGGTPSVRGAVMAEDACDTPSSPVHANSVSGNFTLIHDDMEGVPLSSIVRITAWNEFS